MSARRILVADDSDIMRVLVRRIIEKADGNAVIVEARDGLEAITAAQSERFDGAYTDWKMPFHDGLEVVRRLRTASPSARIVFASAHLNADVTAEAVRCGADSIIRKPFAPHEIVSALRLESAFLSVRSFWKKDE